MTEEEPFSACYIYWYNRYINSCDPESLPMCSPVMFLYHSIFTLSKDPNEDVMQMVQNTLKRTTLKNCTEWILLEYVYINDSIYIWNIFSFLKYMRLNISSIVFIIDITENLRIRRILELLNRWSSTKKYGNFYISFGDEILCCLH